MHVLVEGSGGRSGWPEPGCRCASCLRCRADGTIRKRSAIVVDGALRLGGTDGAGGADGAGVANGANGADGADGAETAGFRVRRLPDARGGAGDGAGLDAGDGAGAGGWEVTSADGGRLLYPAGPGAVPVPAEGAARYDIAFLDMLGDPAQLGRLRARGLVTADTVTAVAFADHRVSGAAELERRCGFWRVRVPADGEAVTTPRSAQGSQGLTGATRPWVPWRVLVIGGARSGKSERAELRVAAEPEVTYVATDPRTPRWRDGADDRDWAARVAAHRARRPAWWRTVETTDLAGVLASARGAVLIDGIGTWLTAVLDECDAWDGTREKVAGRITELIAAWRQARALVVAVSDEAGMGVIPATPAGRLFRDELGRLNQALAAESEETELVVAGLVLPLNAG
jgi:adenosylcobinamide kinase/adenosylcobinamide-phosphate guanylyltransferase